MKSVIQEGIAEHTMKKSRFIGYACHIQKEEDALAYIEKIKKLHPQARHHVSAYRISSQILERYDDDNEPKSTAGLPILDSLQRAEIDCVCVVVVRYFGGVLLGKGGLVKAYTLASQLALDAGEVANWSRVEEVEIQVDYAQQGQIDFQLQEENYQIEDKDYSEMVRYKMVIERTRMDAFQNLINNLTRGQAGIQVLGENRAPVKAGKILTDKMEEV